MMQKPNIPLEVLPDTVIANNDLKGPAGGCEVCFIEDKEVKEEKKILSADEIEAEKLGVTVGKLRAMKAYAQLLHRQDPRMKPSRVRSKVAKKFNIKLS